MVIGLFGICRLGSIPRWPDVGRNVSRIGQVPDWFAIPVLVFTLAMQVELCWLM